jgi:hypothetical protein
MVYILFYIYPSGWVEGVMRESAAEPSKEAAAAAREEAASPTIGDGGTEEFAKAKVSMPQRGRGTYRPCTTVR